MPAKRRSELEQDLKCVLSELDDFQSKVEASDNSNQANANLEEDLQKLLRNLDDFQTKVDEADEADVGALGGLLGELQDKLMLGEEMVEASNTSSSSTTENKKPRAFKGDTPEAHLQLYMQRRATKGTQDLPQAILLQNFIERKQKRQSKSWFHDLLFKAEPIESRRAGLFPMETEPSKPDEQPSSKRALKASNEKLKETIVRLEATIAQMEQSYQSEISAHQEVIQNLQKQNMKLHETIFSLKKKQQDMETYEDIINQLQKENVQLHYKLELLVTSSQEDPLGDPPGYLSSSLEDSYSQSPSLQEMTNRMSPKPSMATTLPFNILRLS